MIGIYVGSVYSLFLTLIILNKNQKSIYYFIGDEFKNLNLKNKLELSKIENKNKIVERLKLLKENSKVLRVLKNKNIEKLYLHDHLAFGQLLLNNFDKEINLIEDGTLNYNKKILFEEKSAEERKIKRNNFFRKRFIEKVKKHYKKYGLSEKIKNIYLTGKMQVPELIAKKVVTIDIEKAWNLLSDMRKNEILQVFSLELEELERLKNEQDKILLLTQPLSEDGYYSEKEKIEIYRKILERKGIKKLCIKPHPREKTDYKKELKEFNIEIINGQFPIEIFMLLDFKFKEIITLFSTAGINLKDKYTVDFIGTKNYPKLCREFGIIEGFYKN